MLATKQPSRSTNDNMKGGASVVQSDDVQSRSSELLTRLFDRFQESSEKLDARYAALTKEVDDLKEQLARKEEVIKRSERLSMLGETAAALAHEVRNPLGAITLFLSMLRADVSDRPSAVGLLDEIERGVTSLDHVVSNVLHFAKNNRPVLVPINIHSILLELSQHFESLYGPGVTFRQEFSGSPFSLGDEQSLRQCFYNLIMNALQAMKFSGAVTLKAKDDVGAAILISITDSGPGIPAEILPRLFEPFVSGREHGTGLGLSIVQRIVEAHGGEIFASNAPSAQFDIRLPREVRGQSSETDGALNERWEVEQELYDDLSTTQDK